MEQGLLEGCLGKTVTFSHIHQSGDHPGWSKVKTIKFSHINQLEIISGEARVAGRMSGKDCYIQSQPSTGDHIRWSKGCRWDVWKRLSHLVTAIN